MLIVFDWDGTIAKKEVANEASIRRLKELGMTVSKKWMENAQKNHSHYDVNKQLIEKKYGIKDERKKTIKMTDLFRKYYTKVVSEWKNKVFYEDMFNVLKRLKKDNELAIISTLRQDLIDNSLKILGCNNLFKYVYANSPALDHSKSALMKMLLAEGRKPALMIGDRYDDLIAGKEADAKTILVLWGNNTEEAKDSADYIIRNPKEILDIVEEVKKLI